MSLMSLIRATLFGLFCVIVTALFCWQAHQRPIPAPDSPVSERTAEIWRITANCPNKPPERPRDGQTRSEAIDRANTSIEALLDAIEQVESGGDPNAVGDGGEAVGSFQIHKIYVDDVNRINTFGPKYSYDDRYDKDKSREMTKAYLCWYIRFTRGIWKKPEWEGRRWEYMARIHNGGPDGWKKESTKAYWEKVKAVLYE